MSKETFDFSEALRRMKEGKKVRSIGWGIVDKLWIDKDKNIKIDISDWDDEMLIKSLSI